MEESLSGERTRKQKQTKRGPLPSLRPNSEESEQS